MATTVTSQIQGITISESVKAPVQLVFSTNITLAGLQGGGIEGTRSLVMGQTTTSENGIYNQSTGAWERSKDFDGNRDVVKGTLVIDQSNTNVLYRVTSSNPIIIGASAILFEAVGSTLTQSDIGQLLNPITAAEIAAGVTPVSYVIPSHEAVGEIIVDRYGNNVTPGTTDMFAAETAAQSVLAQLPAGGKIRYLNGTYYSSDTVLVRSHRTNIEGAGKHATSWSFNPASAKARFKFQRTLTSEVLYQCSIRRGNFAGAGSQQKIALDMSDVSETLVEEISVQASWTGNSGSSTTPSIGIRTSGRELWTGRQLDVYADRPFQITRNANSPSLSADHFHFTDVLASAQVSTEASILIDADAGLASFTADGYLALVGGKYGIRYLDGTEPSVALGVHIQNLRFEQPADLTGYAIDWNCGTKEFTLDTCNLGGNGSPTNGGLRLRNVNHITLLNTQYTGQGEALNLDTCECLLLINSLMQDSSTVTLTGMEEVFSLPGISSLQPTFPVTYWHRTASGRKNIRLNGTETAHFSTTLADDATLALTCQLSGALKSGFVTVAAYSATGPVQEMGTWLVTGSAATLVIGTANTASTDSDTDLCVIWTAIGNIVVKNRLGVTVDLVIQEAWKR